MRARTNHYRTAALATTALALVVLTGSPASAEDGDVEVVNTETVQVYMSPTGEVESQRVYEQLALTGSGEVELHNPIETDGLRNIDGFGSIEAEDGEQVVKTTVDGKEKLRTVSDFDGELPLDISVEYRLDGETVEPGDVVGASGSLEVLFTVENVTSQTQELTFDDGRGGTVTKSVEVPIPMVGSLTTVAPESFSNVASEQANLAGDGKGGTKLSFTMTLFPPIGSTKAEFGYTADIEDGVVPRVDVSALPVNPLESPSFKSAATSYQGGADTGAQLAAGATEIDSNLLRLRDGAAELLAGLIKLNDGADQLSDGLNNSAVPGAELLADGSDELREGLGALDDGASQLAEGSGRLDAGANRLADGAGQLSDGADDAAEGSRRLTNGLKQIDDGLALLADGQTGLPAATSGIKQLRDGVALLLAGLGDVNDQKSLIGGLKALGDGLAAAQDGAGQIHGGLQVLVGNTPSSPGIKGARGGVDQVKAGLDAAVRDGGSADQLIGGLTTVRDAFCPQTSALPNGLTCQALLTQLIEGAKSSKASLAAGAAGLGQVSQGLGVAIMALDGQLIPGAGQLVEGLTEAKNGATELQGGAQRLKGGVQQVDKGLGSLAQGITSAVAGVMQLSTGAGDAYSGSSELSDGLSQLDSGAEDLSDGADELADGTGDLRDGSDRLADGAGDAADGSARIADGADELADGLEDAADGSGRLADGLSEAAEGAPQLVDGSERLSVEGMQQLVEAGEETTQSYGEMVAVLHAGADRAQTEKMAYGAPEDSTGLTAYSYVLKGDDGEGDRNLTRGLAALVILGAGGAVLALRRRLI